MTKAGLYLRSAALAILLAASAQATARAAEISSYAFVNDDSTLTISGRLIHLYGIYVPPTGRTCYSFVRPMPCGTRASLALEFKISGDFVRCLPRGTYPDGSVVASCRSGNEDLSEWMLQRGWAVALPNAPFHYAALEKIAKSKGIGVWGIPIDTAPPR